MLVNNAIKGCPSCYSLRYATGAAMMGLKAPYGLPALVADFLRGGSQGWISRATAVNYEIRFSFVAAMLRRDLFSFIRGTFPIVAAGAVFTRKGHLEAIAYALDPGLGGKSQTLDHHGAATEPEVDLRPRRVPSLYPRASPTVKSSRFLL